jgi:pantothenate kinase-related protein Tda10
VDTDDSEQGERLDEIDLGLRSVNAKLGGYARWHELMSAWVVLGVDDPGYVGAWRLEAERAMSHAGRPGMSDEQVSTGCRCVAGPPPVSSPSCPFYPCLPLNTPFVKL